MEEHHPQIKPTQKDLQENSQQQTSQPEQQATYEQVGVPTVAPRNLGKLHGILALISACISLLFAPLLFGLVGIVLGTLSFRQGSKVLGITAIFLSVLCMSIGILLSIYVMTHPEIFETTETVSGTVLLLLTK